MTPGAAIPGVGLEGRRRSQAVLVGVTVAAVVALVTAALVVTVVVTNRDEEPATVSERQGSPVSSSGDVSWVRVAGVALPVSRTHGPRVTRRGRAAGYSRSEAGAAFAAVQVLIRASPAAGPRVFEPVLASQMTGEHLGAMKSAVAEEYEQLSTQYGVEDGDPIAGGDAQVLGYRVSTYDGDAGRAWVDVVLTSPQLGSSARVVEFSVELRWFGDDWRVVAPDDGDWSTAATLLGSPPAGMQAYGSGRGV
jgi:hypothetical protein